MGLKNYYFKNIEIRLSDSDYWDLYLNSDERYEEPYYGLYTGDSFTSYFDFNNPLIYSGASSANTIYSIITWSGATNTGVTLNDIGLTGIDNGLITYDKPSGDTQNTVLLSALTGSTLVISSGDSRLMLHEVTGMTGNFVYPIDISTDFTGEYAQLCGGFYQGFYKLYDYGYEVFPNRVKKGWVAEFWVNKNESCSGYTGTTLNDAYPDNKGFFFFIGTRAENKFWNIFEGNNTGSTSGCTSGCSEWCTIPKESGTTTSSGWPLDLPEVFSYETDNKFVFFNRAYSGNPNNCSCGSNLNIFKDDLSYNGYNVCNFTGKSITMTSTTVYTDSENQFLEYHRGRIPSGTCSCSSSNNFTDGHTTCDYTGRTKQIKQLDYKSDITNNAIGFRIKDDGSIGYRKLGFSCTTESTTGITVEELYSISGLVKDNEWTYVAIRFIAYTTLECFSPSDKPRLGKLMFYVNGKLKFIVDDFEEVIPRQLNEYKEKQEGVPFNISIGGGSQGLIDSQTFDGPDNSDSNLLVEKYFAGTFIGGISKFRFYDDKLSYCIIKNNYEEEANDYGHNISCPCGCK